MGKIYTSLGLMSGTSMDGVDASIIKSKDGKNYIPTAINQYFEYDQNLYQKLTNLRDKIANQKDLYKHSDEIKLLENEITLFHEKITNIMVKNNQNENLDMIGFHGQTIFHNANEKISVQLGDGKLLSKLTGKTVVYNFRQNDIKNGGQGAPLTPIFHEQLLKTKFNLNKWPTLILNIGGISNVTSITESSEELDNSTKNFNKKIFAGDMGPGNCLIDEWIRKKSKYKYDKDGSIAKSGTVNRLILNQAKDNFLHSNKDRSFDIKDFDISFVRGLSLEDGAATLTHFTVSLIIEGLSYFIKKNYDNIPNALSEASCLICGGGRKNKYLIKTLEDELNIKKLISIDERGIDGDFVESQAFGYLAIRSFLDLPITFPNTTGCEKPISGGVIINNF